MFNLFKKKQKKLKEDRTVVAYRMFKEKQSIEVIMKTVLADRLEVIEMIRRKKKERRGE